MKLRVEEISAEAREIAFLEPQHEINRILDAGPPLDCHVEGPISVTISYYRAGPEVFLEGNLSARTASVCARCAEEFVAQRTRAFRYVMAPKVLGTMGEGAGLGSEDVELSEYEGDEIDLSPPIREQLFLAMPTIALCREDCRGLCPRCGTNLNQAACGCPPPQPDTRLAVLRLLKVPRV